MKLIYKLLPFLLILGGVFYLIYAYLPIAHDNIEQQKLNQISNDAVKPVVTNMLIRTPEQTTLDSAKNEIDWEKAQKINKEIVGRIEIPETSIRYFFTQSDDNSYYLTHSLEKTVSKYGTIFLDYRNNSEITSKNTILYGHNMRDGSMFHDLRYYKTKSYYKKHPIILIDTPENELRFQIFTVYVVDADKEGIPTDFASDEDYQNYLSACKERSIFQIDISPLETSEILTLVTCSYETDNARLLVQGTLTKD